MTSFSFALCNVGSEAALKEDVARRHPALRPAFGRPGLVTFKADALERDVTRKGDMVPGEEGALLSPFARISGRSLGSALSPSQVLSTARAALSGPVVLHVVPRELGEDGASDEDRQACAAMVAALRAEGAELLAPGARPSLGERVLDVVVRAGEPTVVGTHVHAHGRWAQPSISIEVPAEAPSRAYRKIEEAIAWAGLRVGAGMTALELGAAPGGAALALARRGVSVVGVDPAAMDAKVLAYEGPSGARVTHLAVPAGALRKQDLPPRIDLLLSDLNLAPPVALRYVERVAAMTRRTLRAAVLTLKMNDARMRADVDRFLERAGALGLGAPIATQLPSNRRELCVVVRR